MRILARDGVRALTHRAVDREAGLPLGSTSYYASTRDALIDLIVQSLAERSLVDADRALQEATALLGHPEDSSADELAMAIARLIDTYASRSTEMRTRYVLLLELDAEDPARGLLSQRSPVQLRVLTLVAAAFERLDIPDALTRAEELFRLTDALLAHRVITGSGTESTVPILSAYLRGLLPAR